MKFKYLLPVFIVFTMFSCSGDATQDQFESPNEVLPEVTEEIEEEIASNFIITTNAAGDFKIGDLIPESNDQYTIVEKTITIQSDEGPYEDSVHSVSDSEGELLIITGEYDFLTDTFSDEIGEINIYSDRYQTIKGIGVGSTITDFATAYPDYKLWYTYVSDMYVIETDALEIQFLLDPNGLEKEITFESDMTPIEIDQFDPETKITSIRMFKPWS